VLLPDVLGHAALMLALGVTILIVSRYVAAQIVLQLMRLEVFAMEDKRKAAFDIKLKVLTLRDVARVEAMLRPFIERSR
jgi:hypothetical protein